MGAKVKLRFNNRVAVAKTSGDLPVVLLSQLRDSNGNPLTEAQLLNGQGQSKDTATINGVPVNQIIGKNGTLRPGIIQQIYAAVMGGSTKNLCPDSDIKFGTTYWTLAGLSITGNAGTVGGNGFTFVGTGVAVGNQRATSAIIGTTPGQKITASVSLDATNCTVNAPQLQIWKGDLSVNYTSAQAVLGAEKRVSVTWTVPAGVTQIALVLTTNNATIANTKTVVFSSPQVEVGATVSPYKANLADDSTGYLKAGSAAIDLASSIHLNKTLTNIGNDSNYVKTSMQAKSIGPLNVPNAQFQIGAADGAFAPPVVGWATLINATYYLQTVGMVPAIGKQSLHISSSGGGGSVVACDATFGIKPGEVLSVGGRYLNYNAPSIQIRAEIYDANNTYLTAAYNSLVTTGVWTNADGTGTGTVVAPANAASVKLTCYVASTAAGQIGNFNEVWASINDVRISGSGTQLGDQRNIPPYLPVGYASVRNAVALTAHSSGAVDVNAHSYTLGNGLTVSMNTQAFAVTGLTVGSTYYLTGSDNTYAGGSPAVHAWSSAYSAQNSSDGTQFGSVTIPSSGSGNGGGIGPCVCEDMWLTPTLLARDARKGDLIRLTDGTLVPIENDPRIEEVPCVRVICENGAELECSVYTPFDLEDGGSEVSKDMYGRKVWTGASWERVADVRNAGLRNVVRISVGGRSFMAGASPDKLMGSHNTVKP